MDRWIDGYHALYTARTLHTVSRCWVRYPYLSVYIYIYLSIYLYLYLYLTRMMAAASMVICIAVGRLLSVESNQGYSWHRHWPTPPEAPDQASALGLCPVNHLLVSRSARPASAGFGRGWAGLSGPDFDAGLLLMLLAMTKLTSGSYHVLLTATSYLLLRPAADPHGDDACAAGGGWVRRLARRDVLSRRTVGGGSMLRTDAVRVLLWLYSATQLATLAYSVLVYCAGLVVAFYTGGGLWPLSSVVW